MAYAFDQKPAGDFARSPHLPAISRCRCPRTEQLAHHPRQDRLRQSHFGMCPQLCGLERPPARLANGLHPASAGTKLS